MRQAKKYFEPFLGGGAMFFHLQHPHSFLSDSNEELEELYIVVRDQVEDLIRALKKHRNEEEYCYQVRAQSLTLLTSIERAARFIFLNKLRIYLWYKSVNSRSKWSTHSRVMWSTHVHVMWSIYFGSTVFGKCDSPMPGYRV